MERDQPETAVPRADRQLFRKAFSALSPKSKVPLPEPEDPLHQSADKSTGGAAKDREGKQPGGFMRAFARTANKKGPQASVSAASEDSSSRPHAAPAGNQVRLCCSLQLSQEFGLEEEGIMCRSELGFRENHGGHVTIVLVQLTIGPCTALSLD